MENGSRHIWLETTILTLNKCDTFLETASWVAAIAFVINMVNILVITPTKLRKRLSYRLVINLSVSDAILDLVLVIYVRTLNAGMAWTLTNFHIILCIYQICGLISLWTLICMSLELFLRMMYPLKYIRLAQMKLFRGIILFIWIISVIPFIMIDMAVAVFTASSNETIFHRAVADDFSPSCINSVCAVSGLLVLLTLYALIFRDIFLFKERLRTIRISLKKSAVTISFVILTYFLCFLPMWVFTFIQMIVGTHLAMINDTALTIECLCDILYALNTLFDPVIYAFRIPIIRSTYAMLWKKSKSCYFKRRNVNADVILTRRNNNINLNVIS